MSSLLTLVSRRTVRPALASVTLSFAVFGLFALVPAASAQYYSAINLTNLGSFVPRNINDAGQFSYANAAGEVFLSGPNGMGPAQSLGTLNGRSLNPGFVNDAGQVAGDAVGNDHAYLSGPNGSGPLKDLGDLGGTLGVYVNGINASGQVTGSAETKGDQSYHAFLSSSNGGPLKDLGTLPSAPGAFSYSEGLSVNASGQVTGDSNGHAFISGVNGEGPLRELGTLGGSVSYGTAINDLGQVAGNSYINFGQTEHAFLSGANGGPLTDLGSLFGPTGFSIAEGVNDAGTVVGTSLVYNERGLGQDAFIYSNGEMTDLNSLTSLPKGVILASATQITNSGLILAIGFRQIDIHNQEDFTFLLTPSSVNPVPEASTTVSFGLLIALGLGGVMIARRKKAYAAV